MKVIIRETNQTETLEIIDPKTNVNYIGDFIGGYAAFTDGQFMYDDERDAFICDQETYDWWYKVVDDNQKIECRISELIEEYGSEAVYDAIENVDADDLEFHAARINKVLDEVFSEKS